MGRKLLVFLIMALLTAPVFVILSSDVQPQAYSPYVSPTTGNLKLVNFTVYAEHVTPSFVATLDSYSNSVGVKAAVFGNLIHLDVPGYAKNSTISFLNSISSTYSLKYFISSESPVFTPYSSFISQASNSPSPSAYLPSSIYKAYNYSGANNRNLMGNGTTIVIIDAFGDPYLSYDLSAFDNLTGLPPIILTEHYLNKTPLQYNKSWALETAMDVEWAHASAPGAHIVLVIAQNANSGLEDAVSYAVTNKLGNIMSLSWGAAESALITQIGASGIATLSQVYIQAYHEGISVFAASGDSGSNDGTSTATVNFPASSPFVTGVGGTSLLSNNNGYEEEGWGGSTTAGTFGSGGGYSKIFQTPYWQSAPGFSGSFRGVPDVAAIADKYTGVLVIYKGNAYQAGGTSLATPIWAGVIARLDQYANHKFGFINPLLYQIARTNLYNKSFNTLSKGSNGIYNVTAGWNPVTGLGSPNVGGLLQAYTEISAPYGFNVLQSGAYNTTYIKSHIAINNNSSQLNNNGTQFYFLTMNRNSSSYLKFGIALNSSGIYAYLNINNGSESFISSHLLMKNETSASLNVSMAWKGNSLTVKAGNYQRIYNIFIPFIGSSLPGAGAEIKGSTTNITNVQNVTFSNIILNLSGTMENVSNLVESHYSGVTGEPLYSSLSGKVVNGTITVLSSGKEINGQVMGNSSTLPEITYLKNYANPVKLHLEISANSSYSVNSWIFNGTSLPGNTVLVNTSGFYTIEAKLNQGNISREVFIESLKESNITISDPVRDARANLTIIINHFSEIRTSFAGNKTINYASINGTNSLFLKANGYSGASLQTAPSTSLVYTLIPIKPVLTVYVSPGIATVTADSKVIHGYRGLFSSEVNAGNITLNVNSTGFTNFSKKLFLLPGHNLTENIQLTPVNPSGLFEVKGHVRDALFYFGLKGVEVSEFNRTITYTNSTGNFEVYLPAGNHTLYFSLPLYNNTSDSVDLISNSSFTVDMFAAGLSSFPYYSIHLQYALPLLFFMLYLSWSSQSAVSKYTVYYSTSQNFNTYNSANISGNQNYAIFYIYPVKTYYVQIFGYSASGAIVSSNEVVVAGGSVLNLVLNSVMAAGLGIYIAVAASYMKKAFGKKKR